MNEKELREIITLLEEAGVNAELCDTPVPYFSSGVPAGYPQMPGDYDDEFIMMPRELLKRCDFVVKVKGDSMKDLGISDADDVMVKSSEAFDDGDVVVALLDGETTLKSYFRDADNEEWLVPANEAYQPIRLADFTTVYILGKVTGVQKKQPRATFSSMQRRLKEVRKQAEVTVTDESVRKAVAQVLADIKVSRLWFCVYRVLVDVGYLQKGQYEGLKLCMDALFPGNDFDIHPRDLSRIDVGSFSKSLQLWNENNAPVTGKRFRDYQRLAHDLYALLRA